MNHLWMSSFFAPNICDWIELRLRRSDIQHKSSSNNVNNAAAWPQDLDVFSNGRIDKSESPLLVSFTVKSFNRFPVQATLENVTNCV